MKLSIIGTTALLFGASFALVNGQDRPGGRGPGGPEGGHRPPPADIAKNLSERFTALAACDTDKNGKLDETEQAAVAKAIEAGTLEVGPPRSGKGRGDGKGDGRTEGGRPSGDVIAGHVTKLYESLAGYDADKNGALDETEQAAVASAIKDGSLKLPRPGGPRGPRGPRGGRPGKE